MSKRQKTIKKFPFAIRFSLSLKDLYSKYEIQFTDKNVTNLEIEPNNAVEALTYFDESRKMHRCMLSKIDFSVIGVYSCYWDKHKFDTMPIGCPIKYVPDMISRTYFSEISKDKFSVKESIVKGQFISDDIIVKTNSNDYYETDGVFCCFGCLLAFVRDPETKRHPMYKDSEMLTFRMHEQFFGNTKIAMASHWRVLKAFGGWVDIDDFRGNIQKLEYEYKGKYNPYFKSTSFAFEEKIKF
jgi:hypothetical protein